MFAGSEKPKPNPVEQLKAFLTNNVINEALKPMKDRLDFINQELNRTHALVQTMMDKGLDPGHQLTCITELREDYLEALDAFTDASKNVQKIKEPVPHAKVDQG